MATQGNEAAVSVDRCGEFGRDQHLAAERLAQSLDAGNLVNCRADHGEKGFDTTDLKEANALLDELT